MNNDVSIALGGVYMYIRGRGDDSLPVCVSARVIRYVISWAHSAITSYVNYSACIECARNFGTKTPRGKGARRTE